MTLPRRPPWSDLAPLRVGTPNIGDRARLHELLDEILDRRWLTNHGPVEAEFEQRLLHVVGTRHCIPVANGTLGLLVVLIALGRRGPVVTPSFTFPALPHIARLVGFPVVFCDIDPVTHMVDPAEVRRCVDETTTAVVPVHLWGSACDTKAIAAAAGDVPVIYDAAHAFAALHDGCPIGDNGRCEVFSFHATKGINSFEGGAVATNDDDLAERVRLLINFGFTGRDQVAALGLNAKMSEIHAAMGLVSLDALPTIIAASRAHHQHYETRLKETPGVRMVSGTEGSNFNYVVVEIEPSVAVRDDVLRELAASGVDARRYFNPPCHRMQAHQERGSDVELRFTDAVAGQVLQLPTGLAVTEDDVDVVCDVLLHALT